MELNQISLVLNRICKVDSVNSGIKWKTKNETRYLEIYMSNIK